MPSIDSLSPTTFQALDTLTSLFAAIALVFFIVTLVRVITSLFASKA